MTTKVLGGEMNEQVQHASGGVATLIILLMPIFKEYSPLVVGALIGVMHPVSKVEFPIGWDGKLKAALYMLKWIGTAVLLTGFVSAMLEKFLGIQAALWPEVVSFFIAFLADDWYTIKAKVRDGLLVRFLGKRG